MITLVPLMLEVIPLIELVTPNIVELDQTRSYDRRDGKFES
jgi:hypothetical protein